MCTYKQSHLQREETDIDHLRATFLQLLKEQRMMLNTQKITQVFTKGQRHFLNENYYSLRVISKVVLYLTPCLCHRSFWLVYESQSNMFSSFEENIFTYKYQSHSSLFTTASFIFQNTVCVYHSHHLGSHFVQGWIGGGATGAVPGVNNSF